MLGVDFGVTILIVAGLAALAALATLPRWFPAVQEYLKKYVRESVVVRNPTLIVNRWSGDGKANQVGLIEEATRRGIRVVMLERGDDLPHLAREAIDAGADAIGMAGGDGSLGLVASVAVERDVPFFCVPVGTRNHFALDLGLDRDEPLVALEALEEGDELAIDYAIANSRVFLNNVSLGVYGMAVHQEGYRNAKRQTLQAVLADTLEDPERQPELRFTTPDGRNHDRSPLIMVSNNRYVMTGPPDFGRRTRLDSGRLGVGAVTSTSASTNLLSATLNDLGGLQEWEAQSLNVESDHPIQAGVDGEAILFESPLQLSIVARGLKVLVPEGTRPGYLAPGKAAVARLIDLVSLGGEDESVGYD